MARMSKKASQEREVLSGMISALAGLSEVTVEMLERQLEYVHELGQWAPKYDAAAKKSDFWRSARKGSSPKTSPAFF
jgi:hypothetical protein